MGYTSININYNEGTLCEEISFSEPGEQTYSLGSTITLSDSRLSRDRQMIIMTINYSEDGEGGLITTVSGFSLEYIYTRKAATCDISFFTMTLEEYFEFISKNPRLDYEAYYMYGDEYGNNGWTMHLIASSLAEWMGIGLINTVPDYHINDFTISIGSTFFEALNSLVSEFEPIIAISGGVLYILERSGAGTLNAGQTTLIGSTNRSVDREHTPQPGCIRVEGEEGEYIATKDPTALYSYPGATVTYTSAGTVTLPADTYTTEDYLIEDTYYKDAQGNSWALESKKVQTITIVSPPASLIVGAEDPFGFSNNSESKIEEETIVEYYPETFDYKYDQPVIKRQSVRSYSYNWVMGGLGAASTKKQHGATTTEYFYDSDWVLVEQVETKFYVYDQKNWGGGTAEKFDIRNYDDIGFTQSDLDALLLLPASVTTTKYTIINNDAYAVDTTFSEYVYRLWPDGIVIMGANHTFEHELVVGGGAQQNKPAPKTLTVYAGTCCPFTMLSIVSEPPKVFNISTPSWNDIEICYIYLSALVSYRFQIANTVTPLIDPLPLMAVDGLGSIIESGIVWKNYIVGYTINIENSGYTTSLELEARCA